MKVDEAIEIAEASNEAHGGLHIIGALKALTAEVTRLQDHVTRASRRVLEPGYADDLTKFMAELDVESLPPGVWPYLYMAKEHIKDLERMVAFRADGTPPPPNRLALPSERHDQDSKKTIIQLTRSSMERSSPKEERKNISAEYL